MQLSKGTMGKTFFTKNKLKVKSMNSPNCQGKWLLNFLPVTNIPFFFGFNEFYLFCVGGDMGNMEEWLFYLFSTVVYWVEK